MNAAVVVVLMCHACSTSYRPYDEFPYLMGQTRVSGAYFEGPGRGVIKVEISGYNDDDSAM